MTLNSLMIVIFWQFAMSQCFGSKIQDSDDDTDNSEWEKVESQTIIFSCFQTCLFTVFCYDKDLLHNSIKNIFLDLSIRESFFTKK